MLRRASLLRGMGLLLAPALLSACGGTGEAERIARDTDRIRLALDTARKSLESDLGVQVPSLNLLIQTARDRFFLSSAGPGGRPITADTHFRFAGNTRMFTATAILKMQQDGWLSIDSFITDPIPGTHLPFVPDTPTWDFPFKSTIQIRQLLQHTAGVYDVDHDPVPPAPGGQSFVAATAAQDPTHEFTVTEMVEQLGRYQLAYFPPGTGHQDSNTGYAILSEIIARVYSERSGRARSFGDYLADHITGQGAATRLPMALRLPTYFPERASDTVVPAPYSPGTVLRAGGSLQSDDQVNMSSQIGAGNGWGSMDSLNTFVRLLMKGQHVLSPANIALMQGSAGPGAAYALGTEPFPNLGFGQTGARVGNLSLAAYEAATDTSVVAYLPFSDERNGRDGMVRGMRSLFEAAWGGRSALGLPGEP
jgi:D-alanyl-D-alanine carboxypeptidase